MQMKLNMSVRIIVKTKPPRTDVQAEYSCPLEVALNDALLFDLLFKALADRF